MKLHLPSSLRSALLACMVSFGSLCSTLGTGTFAAGAMAYTLAVTQAEAIEYSGTIYTWEGSGNLSGGPLEKTAYESGTGTYTLTGEKASSWSNVQPLVSTISASTVHHTLRFAANSGAGRDINRDFEVLRLGGVIVETGATGFRIVGPSGNKRLVELGNNGAAAYSSLKEDFAINMSGSANTESYVTLKGMQTWDIADGKTFTLAAGSHAAVRSAESLNLSIIGGGTAALTGAVEMAGDSAISIAQGAALTLAADGTASLQGRLTNAGTLKLDGTVMLGAAGITNNNVLTLGDSLVFDLRTATAGTVTLVTGSGNKDLTSLNAGSHVKGLAGYSYIFNNDGTVTVQSGESQPMIWGGGSGTWGGQSTPWTQAGAAAAYASGSAVIINGNGGEIALSGQQLSSSVSIEHSGYTLTRGSAADTLRIEGDLTVKESVSTKMTFLPTLGNEGHIVVNRGAMLDLSDVPLSQDMLAEVAAKAVGDGIVKLKGGTGTNLEQSLAFNTNVSVEGGWWLNGRYAEPTLTITEGHSFRMTGELNFGNTVHVEVAGGTLEVQGGLAIGHSEGNYPATLSMSSGEIITSAFKPLRDDNTNSINITGGKLTMTGREAFSASGASTRVSLSDATLTNGETDMVFNHASTLTNVTISAKSGTAITIGGAGMTTTVNTGLTTNGRVDFLGTTSLRGNTALNINGETSIANLSAASDTNLTLSGRGSLALTGAVSLNSLSVQDTTALKLDNANLSVAQDSLLAGITVTGNTTLAAQNGASLTLTQSITNSGVLTLTGTIIADALESKQTGAIVSGYLNTAGAVGTSGFYADAVSEGQVVLATGTGTVNADAAKVMYRGGLLSVGSNGTATGMVGNIDYSTYYINGDSASLSAILAKSPSAAVQMAGGTLTVDTDCTTEIRHDKSAALTFIARQTGGKEFSGYGNLVFENISSSSYGGAIFNGGIFTLSGNEDVTFSGNGAISSYCSYDGGAIDNSGTFTLSGNGDVTFSGNRASYDGGAIDNSSTFTLSGNGDVTFSGNSASSRGGAIYNIYYATFTLSGNGNVSFSGNRTSAAGGAICNGSDSSFELSENGDVTFSGNAVSAFGSSYSSGFVGGAIFNDGTFTLSGNGAVTFSCNTASVASELGGGAIYNDYDGVFSLNHNDSVSFCNNNVADDAEGMGGAILNAGVLELNQNGAVAFEGNTAARGGAIFLGAGVIPPPFDPFNSHPYSPALFLCDNESVTFSGNTASATGSSAASGGAICIDYSGTFSLSGNGDVLFEKNAEVRNGSYRLRSIYSTGTLNLSASEGKSILFRDSVYAIGTVNLNTDGTGDIIFTGESTEADLREVKGGIDGTAQEIADSRSSVLDATVTLGGGTLQVRDAASLTVRNLTAADGSELVLHDASFSTTGDSTLAAVTITGNSVLAAQEGASLTVKNLTAAKDSALVLHEASFTTTGDSTLAAVSISGNTSITAQQGATLMLTQAIANNGNLTLSGTLDVSGLSYAEGVPGYINTEGESSTSGFACWDDRQIVVVEGSGSLNADSAVVLYMGNTLTLNSSGVAALSGADTVDYSTYYINGDSASLSAILAKSPTAAVQMTGGILTVDTDCTTEIRHDEESLLTFTARQMGGRTFSEYGDIVFENICSSSNYGGAIYNSDTFSLNDNGAVTFSGNTGGDGGAIFNSYGTTFTLSGNGDVTFSGNTASYGGAIYNNYYATFTLSENGDVTFSGNTASYIGGAIDNGGTFTLSGNGDVTFSGNTASSSYGSSYGGAIYNGGTFTLSGNGNVSFSGNTASSSSYGSSYGGAIYNGATFTLSGNGNVSFSGNTASSYGGAIFNHFTFTLSGNGNVLFEKNAEIANGVYRLRSIYSEDGSTLNLSASEGKSILFRDSVYAIGTVNLNTDGTGDIIFTGESTEADLREVKGGIDGTAQEIADSRSSVLDAMVTLGGGTLQVRDAASLTVKNLTAAAGSELVLHDASFTTTGNTTLAAVTITGNSSLTAQDGATLTLTQSITNNGALTLSGTFNADAFDANTVEAIDYINAEGERGRSGFLHTYGSCQLNLTEGTGTLNADAAIVRYQGIDLTWTLGGNNVAAWEADGEIDYSIYYVNEERASLSSICAKSPTAGVQMNGGVLELNNLRGSYANKIEGSGAVLINGSSMVMLTGQNSYSGGTRVEAGTLVAGNVQALGTAAVELAGGTLDLSRLDVFANDITGAGSLTINTEHTLELSGHNTYSGGTRVEAGTLAAGNVQAFGTGAVELAGGMLDLGSYALTNELHVTGDAVLNNANRYTGKLVLDGGALSGTALQLNQNAELLSGSIANNMSGKGGVVKKDSGTVVLNGQNTYSGGTRVEAGTLVAGNGQALGTGAVELAGGTLDVSRLDAFANDITGAGSLTINTEHTLELSGHNTYSGGTRVEAGTLVAGNVQAFGTGAVELAGGTLDLGSYVLNNELHVTGAAALNNANRYTGKLVLDGGALSGTALQLNQEAELLSGSIANNMTGKGGVVKNGSGTAVLSGMNTYDGTTIVNEGTLQVSGLVTSNIELNGGTLDTDTGMTLAYGQSVTFNGGAVTGNLQTSDGSSLLVQTGTTISGNLTLNGGDITFINKGSDEVLDISGTLEVNPSQMKLVGYDSAGQYVLAHCGALTGSLGNFDLTTSFPEGSRQQAVLTNASNYLILTVTGDATTLNWAGGSGTWAKGNGTKWTGPTDTKFYSYDTVVFEKGGTVTISGEVMPREMLVGGSTAVTLRGTGSITGDATLTKTGSCTLTMNATNTYTGGTVIEEGVVKAGGDASFGENRVVLHGGELNLNAKAVTNEVYATGGTISGGSAYAGTLTVEGAVALSGTLTAESVEMKSGSLTGGELTDTALYSHGGTLAASLTGESEWTVEGDVVLAGYAAPEWGTYITAGSLTVADGGELDGDVVLTGGTLVSDLHTVHERRLLELSGGSVIGSVVVEQDGLFTMYAESGISGDLSLESGALFENNGNALIIGGTLSVAKDSSAVLSGVVKAGSVSLQQGATVELMDGNALLSVAVGAEKLTFSGIELTEAGMRGSAETPALLDNAFLKLAEGTSFTVENMVLGAHTRITDDPAALELNNATVMLAAGVNVAPVGTETLEEAALVQCGGQQMLTTPAGSTVMQLEASTFDSVTLTGNTLALKLSGIEQSELQSYTYVGVSFINGGDYARFDSDLVVTLTVTDACGHQTLTGWYRADEQAAGGISQVLFETAMMPEPATATLSLLALAALAARRRRR